MFHILIKSKIQSLTQMPTFYDKILVAVVLIASLVSYGIFALQSRKSPDDIVVVRQSGAVIFKLTQEEMKKDGIYDFKFDGGIGYLEIKDGKVRLLPMERSICPEAICSNTGWIDGNPKIIVCVPNRLVVSFIKDKSSEPDGIAF